MKVLVAQNAGTKVYHYPNEENPETPKCTQNRHGGNYILKDEHLLVNHRLCKDCSGEKIDRSNMGAKLSAKLERMDPSEAL